MTGLNKIIDQITQDAKLTAERLIAEAEEKAAYISKAAEEEGNTQARSILQSAELTAQDMKSRAVSSAQFEKRNKLLLFKQQSIEGLITDTRLSLENADAGSYFKSLETLVTLYARKESATMQLNARDLARMPENFAAAVSEAAGALITISETPCTIGGGFLLIYDGIDINCSFEALFEDKADEIRDLAGTLLFPGS